MATAKWGAPSAQGSDIGGSTLNGLTSTSTGAFFTYDNSTNLDELASVSVALGSFTPGAGATVILRAFACSGSDVPDNSGSAGGGDYYVGYVTSGAGVKSVVFPAVQLYPESMRFCITNSAGATLAGSGNSVKVRPYNRAVA